MRKGEERAVRMDGERGVQRMIEEIGGGRVIVRRYMGGFIGDE